MALAQLSSSSSMVLPRREALARPRSSGNTGAIAWLLLASVLAGIASLLYLTQTSEVATTGYSIQELKQEESAWQLRNEQLALEVARAKSLATVEVEATTRLLMTRPKGVVYLQLKQTQSADRPTPASRGDARGVPALEKPAEASTAEPAGRAGLLDTIRSMFASLLAPRLRQGEK